MSDIINRLWKYCSEGNLKHVEIILSDMPRCGIFLTHNKKLKAFKKACIHGHLKIVELLEEKCGWWLIEKVKKRNKLNIKCPIFDEKSFKKDEICSICIKEKSGQYIFKRVCEKGQSSLDLIKWLIEKEIFAPIIKEDNLHQFFYNLYLKNIFLQLCRNGQADIVGLFMEEIAVFENYELPFMIKAFQEACKYGQLEVVKFLVEKCQFTIEHIKNSNNQAMFEACINSHYKVARWLGEGFGEIFDNEDGIFSENGLRYNDDELLKHVCRNDKSEFREWIIEKINPSAVEMLDILGVK